MKKNMTIFCLLITAAIVIGCAPKNQGTSFKTELVQAKDFKNNPQTNSEKQILTHTNGACRNFML